MSGSACLASGVVAMVVPVRHSVSRFFGPLDARWVPLSRACEPSQADINSALADLVRMFGREGAGMVLSVPALTIRAWLKTGVRSAPARRMVWFAWAALLHPERLRSAWDIVTWGMFAHDPRVRKHVRKLSQELTPQAKG